MEIGPVGGDAQTDDAGSPTREISRGIVGLYKEYLGRGPTRAKTSISEDLVVTVLEDSLTKAELRLSEIERPGTVRGIRREFQDAMREDILALVEKETKRSALCMLSDHSPNPDYAVEVVILAPQARDAGPLGTEVDSQTPAG